MIENEVALEILDCNGLLCGRIVYLRIPRDETGELKREQENPRAGLRPRLICGMTVLEDLRPVGPDNWDLGRFYDPRDGGRYSIAARLISRNVIIARIYSGSRVNGQSQTLLRYTAKTHSGLGASAPQFCSDFSASRKRATNGFGQAKPEPSSSLHDGGPWALSFQRG